MLRRNDCSKKGAPQKKAAALKKELLRKSNSCVTLKKITLKKCEEVDFPKIKLSKKIADMREGKLPLPDSDLT